MNVKRWAALLALAAGILWIASGCGIQQNFLAKNEPSPTSTRRPRPTFTPRPVDTDTPVPTDTLAATDTPQPTDTSVPPTAKPVVRATATRRPPTAIPQPTAIPATPVPTKPPYQYLFTPLACNPAEGCNVQSGVKCFHSGNHYIDVFVASDYKDQSSVVSGVHVRFAFSPGGPKIDPDELTAYDGKAEKTLSAVFDPPGKNVGTYYAWVIDGSGNRISDYSPAIVINAKGEDDPQTCWAARIGFAGGY